MIRYGNDSKLAGLEQTLLVQMKEISRCLTNGYLDTAFLVAHDMETALDAMKRRLNEIKYGR